MKQIITTRKTGKQILQYLKVFLSNEKCGMYCFVKY